MELLDQNRGIYWLLLELGVKAKKDDGKQEYSVYKEKNLKRGI